MLTISAKNLNYSNFKLKAGSNPAFFLAYERKKILMVCLGNICRSPLAEGILAEKCKHLPVFVHSAGTSAYHIGEAPDIRSQHIASVNQINISDQRARVLKPIDIETFDIIYVMDESNYTNTLKLVKNTNDKFKIDFIMNVLNPGRNINVPYPYLGGDEGFNIIYNLLNDSCEEIKIQLSFNDSHDILSDIGDIPGADDDGNEFELDLTVTSSELKDAIGPVFQQATDICKELLKRNNLQGSDLSTILLVGGPTYSPILRGMLKDQICPNVNTSIDPMTAVASGAALFASTKDIPAKHQKRDKTKIQLDLKYEELFYPY